MGELDVSLEAFLTHRGCLRECRIGRPTLSAFGISRFVISRFSSASGGSLPAYLSEDFRVTEYEHQ